MVGYVGMAGVYILEVLMPVLSFSFGKKVVEVSVRVQKMMLLPFLKPPLVQR